AALGELAFFEAASLFPVPASSAETPYVFVLALFLGPGRQKEIDEHRFAYQDAVRLVIERRLGADLVPDRIELYPLQARMKVPKGGKVLAPDHSWCQAQFIRGSLARKSREEGFALIAELRALVAAGDGKGG